MKFQFLLSCLPFHSFSSNQNASILLNIHKLHIHGIQLNKFEDTSGKDLKLYLLLTKLLTITELLIYYFKVFYKTTSVLKNIWTVLAIFIAELSKPCQDMYITMWHHDVVPEGWMSLGFFKGSTNVFELASLSEPHNTNNSRLFPYIQLDKSNDNSM